MAFTVEITHKTFGKITLENITEIHYIFPSAFGKRIAFESDIDSTGYTYNVEDIKEFEARVQEN